MKKHVNLIATSLLSASLVLGGVGYVMLSQNQDIVKPLNLKHKSAKRTKKLSKRLMLALRKPYPPKLDVRVVALSTSMLIMPLN